MKRLSPCQPHISTKLGRTATTQLFGNLIQLYVSQLGSILQTFIVLRPPIAMLGLVMVWLAINQVYLATVEGMCHVM